MCSIRHHLVCCVTRKQSGTNVIVCLENESHSLVKQMVTFSQDTIEFSPSDYEALVVYYR